MADFRKRWTSSCSLHRAHHAERPRQRARHADGISTRYLAKRYAVDLAVVLVAGGRISAHAFRQSADAARHRPAAWRSRHAFCTAWQPANPEARLAAFRHYGRPSITARLSVGLERTLLGFTDDTSYRLVHVSRLYLASLAATWMPSGMRPLCLVLDCDEDDARAYRRLARLNRNWGRDRLAAWADAEADAFKALATQWLPRFDLRLAASSSEARWLGARVGRTGITVIPNVVPGSAVGTRSAAQEWRAPRDPLCRQYELFAEYRCGDVVCLAHLAEAPFRRALSAAVHHRRPRRPA